MNFKTLSLKDYAPTDEYGANMYATWVATGRKPIETRKWQTSWRGDIAIHCSKSSYGTNGGKILVVANLYDIVPFTPDMEEKAMCDWYEGYAWMLDNIRIVYPQPIIRGQLNLFNSQIDLSGPHQLIPLQPRNPVHLNYLDPKNLSGWHSLFPPSLIRNIRPF